MTDEISEQEKALFKRASERRRENGVRLKRFTVMGEASQVEALNELLESWVERYGKRLTLDNLIVLWARVEARLRDAERAKDAAKR